MYNWLFGGLLHAELKIFTVGEWNTAIDWYINNSSVYPAVDVSEILNSLVVIQTCTAAKFDDQRITII